MSILQADRVSKIYHTASEEVAAVRDVTLRLDRGEVVVLMGPSGSGKTTLLSVLGCILTPDDGALQVCGEHIEWNESVLPGYRRRFYGYVAQRSNLLSSLTVEENVGIPLLLAGIRGEATRERVERAVETVGLAHRLSYPVMVLSGGEKQRVAVARAIVSDAPILLADEPTANLDRAAGAHVLETLRGLADEHHKSVLMVTHDERHLPYADRSYRMEDGCVSAA